MASVSSKSISSPKPFILNEDTTGAAADRSDTADTTGAGGHQKIKLSRSKTEPYNDRRNSSLQEQEKQHQKLAPPAVNRLTKFLPRFFGKDQRKKLLKRIEYPHHKTTTSTTTLQTTLQQLQSPRTTNARTINQGATVNQVDNIHRKNTPLNHGLLSNVNKVNSGGGTTMQAPCAGRPYTSSSSSSKLNIKQGTTSGHYTATRANLISNSNDQTTGGAAAGVGGSFRNSFSSGSGATTASTLEQQVIIEQQEREVDQQQQLQLKEDQKLKDQQERPQEDQDAKDERPSPRPAARPADLLPPNVFPNSNDDTSSHHPSHHQHHHPPGAVELDYATELSELMSNPWSSLDTKNYNVATTLTHLRRGIIKGTKL